MYAETGMKSEISMVWEEMGMAVKAGLTGFRILLVNSVTL